MNKLQTTLLTCCMILLMLISVDYFADAQSRPKRPGQGYGPQFELVSGSDLGLNTRVSYLRDRDYGPERKIRKLLKDGWKIQEVIPAQKGGSPVFIFRR